MRTEAPGRVEAEAAGDRPSSGGGYIPTLDGWRAVAIAAVMACHLGDSEGPGRFGAAGVDVFFGISGLLICSRLLDERRKHGRISLASFYVRRTFRILPPYLAYLAVVGALAASGALAVRGADLLSCLLFVRNYLTPWDSGSWYTAHFWSLAVEEHFYLIWPGLLVLLGPPRARWGAAGLAAAVAAWRFADFRLGLVQRLLPGVSFYARTDVRLDGLLWGCVLALLLDDPTWRARLGRWPLAWAAVPLVAVIRFNPPLALLWQAILVPLMLAGTAMRPGGAAGRVLEWAPLRWVGRVSYGLYLWQQMFLVHDPALRSPAIVGWQAWPWNLAAVFACATLSYYAIERPTIALGRAASRRLSAHNT